MQEANRHQNHNRIIANGVLVAAGLGSLGVLAYFFYNYTWTGRQQFTGWDGPVLYYGVPAAAAALFILSLALRADLKINCAILCCSALVSLYGAEAYLAVLGGSRTPTEVLWGGGVPMFERQEEVKQVAKREGVDFDYRTKIEALIDLRNSGIDAVPSLAVLLGPDGPEVKSQIEIQGEEVLPLGGISNRPTLFCNETGQYTVYTSDEHGFNNPPHIWERDKTDIVALGDSFAHGGCVPPDRNFVALLRPSYPMTISAGYPGEGPLSMLAALTETLAVTNPRIVLWFYTESDLFDFTRELKSSLLLHYLEEGFSQKLLFRQEEIDQVLTAYAQEEFTRTLAQESAQLGNSTLKDVELKVKDILKLSILRRRFGLVKGREVSTDGIPETNFERFQDVLLRAKDRTSRSGGKLYFVYLPAWESYGYPAGANKDRARVLSLVKSLDIPLVDVNPAFESQPDPLSLFPFRRFGHFNEKGHQLVAQTVLEHLRKNGDFSSRNE